MVRPTPNCWRRHRTATTSINVGLRDGDLTGNLVVVQFDPLVAAVSSLPTLFPNQASDGDIAALQLPETKRQSQPPNTHGNIPL
jgi:hypothetical protein